ncbi:MAG: hypothetical protein IRY91_16770, partial [Gemmatimonadaceae bacterium]|nr:hypothetical protein [Gemmatimonadaceae bacterium]
VVGSAVGLALTVHARDSRWWIGALLGALPAGVLTLHLLITFTALFVPVFGRLPLPFAPDLALAVMVAIPASGIVLALLPGAHRAGGLGAMAVAMVALTVGALATSVVQPRYTFLRPQRLTIEHRQVDGTGVLRVIGSDYVTPRAALARAGGFHAAMPGPRPLVFERAAGPTGVDAPRAELLASTTDSARGTRTLTIRFTAPGASRFRVRLPRARIAGWSLPAPLPGTREGDLRVAYVAPPDTGWRVSLEVRGTDPLPIELDAVRPHTTHDAATLLRELPTWTDAHVLTVNRGDWQF